MLDHHQMSIGHSFQLNTVFRNVNFITNHPPPRRRFTFQTRFNATLEQNERIQELFGGRPDHEGIMSNNYSRLTPAEWRKYIYDRNLYAVPLPDGRGRHRECSASFYRYVFVVFNFEPKCLTVCLFIFLEKILQSLTA